MTDNSLPKRKHTRLKDYDYSDNGYYFVTIWSTEGKHLFSKIINEQQVVGRGLAPAERQYYGTVVKYTRYGLIAEQQLFALEKRFNYITVDKYVIMPNHIHAILILKDKTAGASPRPTLMDIICAYKSLTVRECHKYGLPDGKTIFQDSFNERVIRNESSYYTISQYIEENPFRWHLDKYYNYKEK